VFVACSIGSGRRDGLIAPTEESYRARTLVCVCVCVCVCVIVCELETSKGGGLGPSWALTVPKNVNTVNEVQSCLLCLGDS
jgi:hypothetical protein